MITSVALRLTGLFIVLHLIYFIHVTSNISCNLLQNLLYFLSENTNISYFLEFLKSYILVEVDSEHCILSKHAESVAKVLPEVGYEPRPSYENRKSPSTSYERSKARH